MNSFFFRLINFFFIFGCWLLPPKISIWPKNNGFARLRSGGRLFVNLEHYYYKYLRQVSGVNGKDNVIVRCLSVCVQWTGHSDQWTLDSIIEMPDAMFSKFGKHVHRESLDMTPE